MSTFMRLNIRVLETEGGAVPNSLRAQKAAGLPTVATVTILDSDRSGIFTFKGATQCRVSMKHRIMEVESAKDFWARGSRHCALSHHGDFAKGGGGL
ncbi:sodium/calcium exchanger 3 isoform X1 [Lates japonicus]|uniref:Sodium/calcium exchanger 3 isoform X1 n=1 Tax=Lates japonicus TaxID=270547 RepID=A0AAD3NG35_LATJO|nr:sodium/calcium exchanger 3 isoform X1 [Lates japonicus]